MKTTLIILALLLCSCSEKKSEPNSSPPVTSMKLEEPKMFWNNPVLLGNFGTSILPFFQSCVKAQNFTVCNRFLSKDANGNYLGEDGIPVFYRTTDFSYKIIRLKSVSTSNGKIVLLYDVSQNATNKILSATCVLENDTAKLLNISIK